MGTSGGTMMQRPPQQPYSPMRGGPMPTPPAKRPADARTGLQQQKT